MRLLPIFGAVTLLAAGSLSGAAAQTSLYVYNFNDAGPSGTNSTANTAALFSVDRTVRAGGSALSSTFDPAFIVDFAGTTINADAGDAAGVALALQGGTGATTTGGGNNGAYLQATANLSGYKNIGFSFAGQRTATGFNSDQFSYSTDGGTTFTNFGTALNLPLAFAAQSFDLSSIAALNNAPSAVFRLTFAGATSSAGNNRLDNLLISGTPLAANPVPETSTMISFALLLTLGAGGLASRRRKTA